MILISRKLGQRCSDWTDEFVMLTMPLTQCKLGQESQSKLRNLHSNEYHYLELEYLELLLYLCRTQPLSWWAVSQNHTIFLHRMILLAEICCIGSVDLLSWRLIILAGNLRRKTKLRPRYAGELQPSNIQLIYAVRVYDYCMLMLLERIYDPRI